ncbi:MAG: hypothetical protein KDC05_13780 [Bacteroidales bacterium]|nr:hypothetical protein [Bacteroidales bacterium]
MQTTISQNFRTLVVITAFSIAMGFMESAVVVYLREIFYPDGFRFPLQPITPHIAVTEILREAATLIMLVTAGMLTGRNAHERFGYFIFAFGIWDITYYLFLYFLLGWPESLLTWDILFLIPVTWVGPVIGPVINSLTMIALALMISHFTNTNSKTRIIGREWLLLILGSLVMIISYTEDYVSFLLQKFRFGELFNPSKPDIMMEYAMHYVPQSFAWWIFLVGQGLLVVALILFWRRNRKLVKR